jgi:hypothetical protein
MKEEFAYEEAFVLLAGLFFVCYSVKSLSKGEITLSGGRVYKKCNDPILFYVYSIVIGLAGVFIAAVGVIYF